MTVAKEPFFLILFDKKATTNIAVATSDIDGPEGRLKKYERYNPVIDAVTPKTILTFIEVTKVFDTSFAAAAGIMSILSTKIIPTVCNEPTIAIDKRIKNR